MGELECCEAVLDCLALVWLSPRSCCSKVVHPSHGRIAVRVCSELRGVEGCFQGPGDSSLEGPGDAPCARTHTHTQVHLHPTVMQQLP